MSNHLTELLARLQPQILLKYIWLFHRYDSFKANLLWHQSDREHGTLQHQDQDNLWPVHCQLLTFPPTTLQWINTLLFSVLLKRGLFEPCFVTGIISSRRELPECNENIYNYIPKKELKVLPGWTVVPWFHVRHSFSPFLLMLIKWQLFCQCMVIICSCEFSCLM